MAEIGDQRRPGVRRLEDGSGTRGVIRDEHATELYACEHSHAVVARAWDCAERAMKEAGWAAPPPVPVDQPELA